MREAFREAFAEAFREVFADALREAFRQALPLLFRQAFRAPPLPREALRGMSTKQPRTLFLRLRVTEDERDAIADTARGLGITTSDLIRQAVLHGEVKVRATDSDAAYELRRLGAMLKNLYPKNASAGWSNTEKKLYWQAMNQLLGYAQQLAPHRSNSSGE